MPSRVVITDPAKFIALLESGADVYGTDKRCPMTAEHVLWAWHHDKDWGDKCRAFWLPNGYYSVEVE